MLLVDDDEDTLELLKAALTQRSASVTPCHQRRRHGSDNECRPDVLISDIAMPDEDGYELMRKVIALEARSTHFRPSRSQPTPRKKTRSERSPRATIVTWQSRWNFASSSRPWPKWRG